MKPATRSRVLRAVASLTLLRGYPPTIREITAACGIKWTSPTDYRSGQLQCDGLLSEPEYFAQGRTLRLTHPDEAAMKRAGYRNVGPVLRGDGVYVAYEVTG